MPPKNPKKRCFLLKIWKTCVLFYLGGMIYTGVELLWRGWSHWSMFLLGGVCFLAIGHLNRVRPRLPMPWRALCGAGIITMLELFTGLLVNRNYAVWDYRNQPMNFHGQICPVFALLWIPLSLAALTIYAALEPRIPEQPLET